MLSIKKQQFDQELISLPNNLLNIQLSTLIFSFSKKFDAALQSEHEQVCSQPIKTNETKFQPISAQLNRKLKVSKWHNGEQLRVNSHYSVV